MGGLKFFGYRSFYSQNVLVRFHDGGIRKAGVWVGGSHYSATGDSNLCENALFDYLPFNYSTVGIKPL